MKRTLLLFFCLWACSPTLFAQSDFQFTYMVGKDLQTFQLSTVSMDLKGLNNAVRKAYEKGQRKPDTEAYWGECSRQVGKKKEKFYAVYEYPKIEGSQQFIIHLYDAQGKWLYSVEQLDAENTLRLDEQRHKYANNDIEVPMHAYSLRDASNKTYYVLDFDSNYLFDPYKLPNAQAIIDKYEGYNLRVVLDKNKKIVKEMYILGNASEIFELHLQAPIPMK
jgi:hypothetical protein